jgi:homoserine kinase type II
VSLWQGKPVILKHYLDGDIVNDMPTSLLVRLGGDLAHLHQIPPPSYLPTKLSYGVERYDEVAAYAKESDFYRWLKQTQDYIEGFISDELPKALIHSDIFGDNIIISKGGLIATVMDFEEACYFYRVFDLGMMIVGTCRNNDHFDMKRARALLVGYQQKMSLQANEVRALQAFAVYGATATAFWRFHNFNHVNFCPQQKNSYQAMVMLADEIRALSAEQFIKGLALGS